MRATIQKSIDLTSIELDLQELLAKAYDLGFANGQSQDYIEGYEEGYKACARAIQAEMKKAGIS
ncbi:hypothetical protein [Helicobacter vulpis]|uniref:hypothetical protein n=1 Tax=Helicobacter vulpis TaxID=2316076 RepID=UPI000EB27A6B|nr:hypothetical protein [Helicobacter vulpis]